MTANLTSRYYSRLHVTSWSPTPATPTSARSPRCSTPTSRTAASPPATARNSSGQPTDSQDKLLALINGARHSLRIYSEEMGDRTIEDALVKAAKRGVDVQVCGENTGGEYDSDFKDLVQGGVHVTYYSDENGFYIHGKVVEADYGTSAAKVFIGSENFSSTSLNRNRELGLITANGTVMSAIAKDFRADFARGQKVSS